MGNVACCADSESSTANDLRRLARRQGQYDDHHLARLRGQRAQSITDDSEAAIKSDLPGAAVKSDFKFIKVIGAGSYGKVYLVQHKRTQKNYAMKVIKKELIFRTDGNDGVKGK